MTQTTRPTTHSIKGLTSAQATALAADLRTAGIAVTVVDLAPMGAPDDEQDWPASPTRPTCAVRYAEADSAAVSAGQQALRAADATLPIAVRRQIRIDAVRAARATAAE